MSNYSEHLLTQLWQILVKDQQGATFMNCILASDAN